MKAGADVAAVTSTGHTPLHQAAEFGNSEVIYDLTEAGADLKATTTANSSTPLHMATFCGSSVVMTLVEAGADLEACASGGFTPLHVAAQEGHLKELEISIW